LRQDSSVISQLQLWPLTGTNDQMIRAVLEATQMHLKSLPRSPNQKARIEQLRTQSAERQPPGRATRFAHQAGRPVSVRTFCSVRFPSAPEAMTSRMRSSGVETML